MFNDKPEAEKRFIIKDIIEAVLGCSKRCASFVLRSSPLEPCKEVEELLEKQFLNTKHVMIIYSVFHRLRQSETDDIIRTTTEVEAESVQQLVQLRRRWVSRILRALLRLGGIEDEGTICWDDFLWIFIRFCSLSEPELCQTLYMIICRDVNSDKLHYLTKDQLKTYFAFYHKCNIKSFNTAYINFDKLPLSRYYVTDFTELGTRFRELINPIIHLQQCLQSHLPSSHFWDTVQSSDFTRKISWEFFTMQRVRVHLRGDPPFRETCDMLAPDALGEERLNQDQWYLRVRGLRQKSVWGEQMTPEQARAEEARIKAEKELFDREKADYERLYQDAQLSGLPPPVVPKSLKLIAEKTGERLPQVALDAMKQQAAPVAKGPDAAALAKKAFGGKAAAAVAAAAAATKDDGTAPAATGAKAPQPKEKLEFGTLDPELLCEEAIRIGEDWKPSNDRPPQWMHNVTVTPAPIKRGPDPPLWRLAQVGLSTTSDGWGWSQQQTQTSWQGGGTEEQPKDKKNVTFGGTTSTT
jgi:hypothetical protein